MNIDFTYYQQQPHRKIGKQTLIQPLFYQQAALKCYKAFYQCLNRFVKTLNYNVQMKQTMNLAKLSKQSCIFYDNVIYVLLVYFVESSQKLQKEGVTLKKIEEKLKEGIPPGSSLKKEQQYLKTAFLELQKLQQNATLKYTTLLPNNKRNQIDHLFQKCLHFLKKQITLLRIHKSTCLQRCISFKIRLNYNPNSSKQNLNKETKFLTRKKEKMFFPKSDKYECECKGETIDKVLYSQQKKYLQGIDLSLQEISNAVFKVNDMLLA